MPAISGVLAVHNRSELLRDTLISLRNQTLEDWECVVVDDHSTEDIQTVVESFQDQRFRYVANNEGKGIGTARNLGNSLVTSPIIAVVDSDDINLPRRFSVTARYFMEHPETEIFYGSVYQLRQKNSEIHHFPGFAPYERESFYERNCIPHPASAYQTSLIQKIRYDEALPSAVDYDFFLSAADLHCRFGWTEEPLVLYRRHPDQISFDKERLEAQIRNAALVKQRHQFAK